MAMTWPLSIHSSTTARGRVGWMWSWGADSAGVCAGSVVGARGVRVVTGSGEWVGAVDGPMAGYRVVAPDAVRYLVVVSMSDCSCVCGCGMWPPAHG